MVKDKISAVRNHIIRLFVTYLSLRMVLYLASLILVYHQFFPQLYNEIGLNFLPSYCVIMKRRQPDSYHCFFVLENLSNKSLCRNRILHLDRHIHCNNFQWFQKPSLKILSLKRYTNLTFEHKLCHFLRNKYRRRQLKRKPSDYDKKLITKIFERLY